MVSHSVRTFNVQLGKTKVNVTNSIACGLMFVKCWDPSVVSV